MSRCKKCGGPMIGCWKVGSFDDDPAMCLMCGETEFDSRTPTGDDLIEAEMDLSPVGQDFVGDRSVYARRRGTARRDRRRVKVA